MSSTYSTNLAIELIGTGDQAGVWGNTTNTNLGTLIEQAISGYVTQAVATGTDTTITIPNGATGVARNMYIELTGTGGTNTNLIVPANKKLYFIFNNSTGAVTVKVLGQTGVSVPQGKKMVLVCNGTDVVNGLNYIADFGTNSFTVTNLTATSATITTLTATSSNITTLTSGSATITNLLGTTLTISGNSFLATSSGNVGIGTTSPAVKLEVTGNIRIQNSGADSSAQVFGPNGYASFLRWGEVAAADKGVFGYAAGSLTLQYRYGATSMSTGTLGFAMDSSGNLGIGTASPGYKLHVAGNAYVENIIIPPAGFGLGSGNTAYINIFGSTAGNPNLITFNTASTERAVIDSSGNLGIGTASPANYANYRNLAISGTTGANIDMLSGSTKVGNLFNDATNFYAYNVTAGALVFGTNNTERMRLDSSGNLGIGTASPYAPLQSAKVTASTPTGGSAAGVGLIVSNNNNAFGMQFGSASAGHGWIQQQRNDGTNTQYDLSLQPLGGNVGIGTASPAEKLDVRSGIVVAGTGTSTTGTRIMAGYYDAGYISTWGTEYASGGPIMGYGVWPSTTAGGAFVSSTSIPVTRAAYVQSGFNHRWYSGGSQTVSIGSAVSMSERMRLDDNGNLGIGTTTVNYRVVADCAAAGNNDNGFAVRNTNSSAYGGSYNFEHAVTGGNSPVRASFISSEGGSGNSFMRFATTISGTLAERMRIDSSGNLGIGTASPTALLHLSATRATQVMVSTTGTNDVLFRQTNTGGNFSIGMDDSGGTNYGSAYCAALFHSGARAMLFGTNNTERGRFTSGGYFKASGTGTYAGANGDYHELRSGSAFDFIAELTHTQSEPVGLRIFYTTVAPNNAGNEFLQCEDNAVTRAVIRSNGGLANYQANDVNLSDERVKTDIAPLGSMWDKFKALEIVTFKYKDQTHDDDNIGVIAQQVESVAPEFVDVGGWGETPEDGVPLKSIYTADMYHAAIKALQEAMARIEQLEAKVAALESK